jgi:hypothetical protein
MNTGLGFNSEMLATYPERTLTLFSEGAFNWTRPDNLVSAVQYALGIRQKYESLFTDPDPSTLLVGYSDNPAIVVYSRKKGDQWVNIIANADPVREQRGRAIINSRRYHVNGLWGTGEAGMEIAQEITTQVTLSPNYVLIIDGQNLPK